MTAPSNVKSISIGDRIISTEQEPFIIAEMSGNHNQSLDRAMAILEAAAAAGAHALKLQTYTAETMTVDVRHGEFLISDPTSLWSGSSLFDLYEKAHTPWDWHLPLMQRARELGVLCFSSPFDATAVDFLESLNVPAYKIASFENTDIALIRKVAQTGKPLIISTGLARLGEIDTAVRVARKAGCKDLILLKCTSTYPAPPEESNLRAIRFLQDAFNVPVGLSDHTLGTTVAIASVAMGAVVIEKHFTLDRGEGGVDSAFSLEPLELRSLVTETAKAWRALGRVDFGPQPSEVASLQFRRSLYITADMKKGDRFTTANVRAIRPGLGLQVEHLDTILGKSINRDAAKGTALAWDLIG